jgi:hypothetical protein
MQDGIALSNACRSGGGALRNEDEWAAWEMRYASTDPADLIDRLCEQLYLPARLLELKVTPKEVGSAEELLIPRHWTIRKPTGTHLGSCMT